MTVKRMPLMRLLLDILVTCNPGEILFTYFLFSCLNSPFLLLPGMVFLLDSYFLRIQLVSHLKSPYFSFYGIVASLGDAKKSILCISSDR